jgi:hypothetical protein
LKFRNNEEIRILIAYKKYWKPHSFTDWGFVFIQEVFYDEYYLISDTLIVQTYFDFGLFLIASGINTLNPSLSFFHFKGLVYPNKWAFAQTKIFCHVFRFSC